MQKQTFLKKIINKKAIIIIIALFLISGVSYALIKNTKNNNGNDSQISKADQAITKKKSSNSDSNSKNQQPTADEKSSNVQKNTNNSDSDKKSSKLNTQDKKESDKNKASQNTNNNSPQTNSSNTQSNSQTNQNSPNPSQPNNPTPPVNSEPTQAEKNNILRNSIQNKYGVKIAYGAEMGSYSPRGHQPSILTNENRIANRLADLDKHLGYYPAGFFKEIKDFDMPLTYYLVEEIGGYTAGLADGQIASNFIITLRANNLFFNRTLHHETMHYIDAYIRIKNYPLDLDESMIALNPTGFVYGTGVGDDDYIALKTTPEQTYFVSGYSKTNGREDRAELFADLMFRDFKAEYHKASSPINRKFKLLADQLNQYLNSVTTRQNRWDRFISY